MEPGVRVRWWLGWHPRYALVAGAVLGFFVGNVVLTWSVRAAMLRGGVADAAEPLRAVVGGGDVFLLVLAALPVLSSVLVGLAVGAGAWLVGAWTVNRHADGTLGRAIRGVGAEGAERDGTAASTAAVPVDDRTPPLVAPARAYDLVDLRPEDDAVSVTRRHVVVPSRSVEGRDAARLRYADLEAVDYDEADGTLRFVTRDGERAVVTGTRPDGLLAALRDRSDVAVGAPERHCA